LSAPGNGHPPAGVPARTRPHGSPIGIPVYERRRTAGIGAERGARRRSTHARERLGIDADEIDGGHYITLSRPHELTDRLHAYAAAVR
jgi:hypothetical protein